MSFKRLLRSPTVDGQEGLRPPVNDFHRLKGAISRCFSTCQRRREHNRTVPISRLPPEILVEIFLRLCPTFLLSEIRPEYRHWYKIAHICHDWRELAISSPVLWGYVDFDWHRKFAELLMSRNRDAPLKIKHAVLYRDTGDTFLELINRTRRRLRVLELTGSRSKLCDVFERMGECSLVALSVDAWFDQPHKYFWLPDSPFLANLCQLSCLSLHACTFQWHSPLYYSSHLTSLELFDIRPNLRPSAQQLLSIIAANAPILENFVLVRSAPTDFNFSSDRFQSISTPRLKTLRLDDSCVPIVASLIIPSTVSFDIVDRTGAAIAADSLRQIEGLARSLTPAARFTSAKVIVGSLLELYAEGPRQQRLRLGGYQPTFWVQNGANALHFFPLENLTELILCGFEEQHTAVNGAKALLESRKEWQTMLISGLIELRVLTIRGGLPALLLETLLERTMLCKGISREARTHYVSPSGVGKLLLPKLARIEFFNCNFDIGLLGLETKPVDMLVAILWARQQHNDLVPTVHFQGSGTIESWELEKLRRLTKVSRGPYEEAWGIADGPQDHHAMAMDALEQLVLLFQGSESVVR